MLCLFGPPAGLAAGAYEPPSLRPKEWALVARLALAGQPLPRAVLARLLFPEAEDPRRASAGWSGLGGARPGHAGLRARRDGRARLVDRYRRLHARGRDRMARAQA